MSEHEKPAPLDELDARLREARKKADAAAPREPGPKGATGGLALALRIGVELVAALVVGGGIGLLLDRWLGTTPWLMIAFFVLGAVAGFMNVYRISRGLGQGVGYRPSGPDDDRTDRPGD